MYCEVEKDSQPKIQFIKFSVQVCSPAIISNLLDFQKPENWSGIFYGLHNLFSQISVYKRKFKFYMYLVFFSFSLCKEYMYDPIRYP